MRVGFYVNRVPAPVVIEAAEASDRHGVDSVWHDESLWERGAISMLSAAAVRTERIRLGLASVNPYVISPPYFALQYGAFSEISEGRAVMGVGSGVESWLAQLGLEQSLPRTSVKEMIEIARSVLAGETTTYEGKAFQIKDLQPHFRPSNPTPLLWGAMGDRSIETCGEVADGWVVSGMEPPAYVERGLGLLRAGAEAAGRELEDLEVIQYHLFSCDEDGDKARRLAKERIAETFRIEFNFCLDQESLITALSAHLDGVSADDYLQMMQNLSEGATPEEAIPDEVATQTTIVGNVEECAEQLRRLEEIGVGEVALRPVVLDDVNEMARLLGEEIKPLVAGPTEVTK